MTCQPVTRFQLQNCMYTNHVVKRLNKILKILLVEYFPHAKSEGTKFSFLPDSLLFIYICIVYLCQKTL